MKRSIRLVLVALLSAVLLFASANAALDYLAQFSNKISSHARTAAENAIPIASLTGESLSIYKLGYAAGYDAAIQAQSTKTRLSTDATNTYILNNWTKKFHKPTCEYALQISENNKRVFYCTREEMINQGFIPCRLCQP